MKQSFSSAALARPAKLHNFLTLCLSLPFSLTHACWRIPTTSRTHDLVALPSFSLSRNMMILESSLSLSLSLSLAPSRSSTHTDRHTHTHRLDLSLSLSLSSSVSLSFSVGLSSNSRSLSGLHQSEVKNKV